MKIGISSWSCPWALGMAGCCQPAEPLTAQGLLGLAAEVSAEVLQIADNLPLHTLPPCELQQLAAAAKDHAIDLEVGTRGLNPENLLWYLDIAGTLGAKLVRTLPHDGADRPDFAEALRRLGAVRRSYELAGVMLAIENHDFYPSSWLKRLIGEADSPNIGVCLDAVNNLGLGESFREVISNLGSLTVNFHCKDFKITRKPTMLGFDVTGCPAGEGLLDLNLALQVFKDKNLSWIIELWLPWQGDIESTLELEKSWLRSSMAVLQKLKSNALSASTACEGR